MEKKTDSLVDDAPTAFYEFQYGGNKYYVNPLKTINIYNEKTEISGIVIKEGSDYFARLEIKDTKGTPFQMIKLDPKIWRF